MKIDPLEDLVFPPIKMQETQSKLSDWLPKKLNLQIQLKENK